METQQDNMRKDDTGQPQTGLCADTHGAELNEGPTAESNSATSLSGNAVDTTVPKLSSHLNDEYISKRESEDTELSDVAAIVSDGTANIPTGDDVCTSVPVHCSESASKATGDEDNTNIVSLRNGDSGGNGPGNVQSGVRGTHGVDQVTGRSHITDHTTQEATKTKDNVNHTTTNVPVTSDLVDNMTGKAPITIQVDEYTTNFTEAPATTEAAVHTTQQATVTSDAADQSTEQAPVTSDVAKSTTKQATVTSDAVIQTAPNTAVTSEAANHMTEQTPVASDVTDYPMKEATATNDAADNLTEQPVIASDETNNAKEQAPVTSDAVAEQSAATGDAANRMTEQAVTNDAAQSTTQQAVIEAASLTAEQTAVISDTANHATEQGVTSETANQTTQQAVRSASATYTMEQVVTRESANHTEEQVATTGAAIHTTEQVPVTSDAANHTTEQAATGGAADHTTEKVAVTTDGAPVTTDAADHIIEHTPVGSDGAENPVEQLAYATGKDATEKAAVTRDVTDHTREQAAKLEESADHTSEHGTATSNTTDNTKEQYTAVKPSTDATTAQAAITKDIAYHTTEQAILSREIIDDPNAQATETATTDTVGHRSEQAASETSPSTTTETTETAEAKHTMERATVTGKPDDSGEQITPKNKKAEGEAPSINKKTGTGTTCTPPQRAGNEHAADDPGSNTAMGRRKDVRGCNYGSANDVDVKTTEMTRGNTDKQGTEPDINQSEPALSPTQNISIQTCHVSCQGVSEAIGIPETPPDTANVHSRGFSDPGADDADKTTTVVSCPPVQSSESEPHARRYSDDYIPPNAEVQHVSTDHNTTEPGVTGQEKRGGSGQGRDCVSNGGMPAVRTHETDRGEPATNNTVMLHNSPAEEHCTEPSTLKPPGKDMDTHSMPRQQNIGLGEEQVKDILVSDTCGVNSDKSPQNGTAPPKQESVDRAEEVRSEIEAQLSQRSQLFQNLLQKFSQLQDSHVVTKLKNDRMFHDLRERTGAMIHKTDMVLSMVRRLSRQEAIEAELREENKHLVTLWGGAIERHIHVNRYRHLRAKRLATQGRAIIQLNLNTGHVLRFEPTQHPQSATPWISIQDLDLEAVTEAQDPEALNSLCCGESGIIYWISVLKDTAVLVQYDLADHTLQRRDLDISVERDVSNVTCCYVAGSLVFSVGNSSGCQMRALNLDEKQGEPAVLPDLPDRRLTGHRLCAIGDRLVLCGGYDTQNPREAQIIGYDGAHTSDTSTLAYGCDQETKPQWESLATLNQPRAYHGLIEYNCMLYAIGGEFYGDVLASVECYDPEKDTWNTMTPMPIPVMDPQLVVDHGVIRIVDGFLDPDRKVPLSGVVSYDVRMNTWSVLENQGHSDGDPRNKLTVCI